ncbi:MAG: pentapeptide repeat-containing protein, partial [Desulfuromonadales bacterium]
EKESCPVLKITVSFRLFVFLGLTVGCLALSAVKTFAFVPEDVERLKSTKKCPGCDLRGVDLRGAHLEQAEMEGANLMGANLEGANLHDAVLDDASLEQANLKKAVLSGASLDHATIDDADLKGAVLDGTTWLDGKVCSKGSVGACK